MRPGVCAGFAAAVAVLSLATRLLAAEPAETAGWQEIHRAGATLVEVKRAPGGVPLVRTRSDLDVPFAALQAVLLDLASFPDWFDGLRPWEVLESGRADALVHGGHDLPWPLRDRDYVVRYRWRTEAGGAFVLEARSADGGPPPGDDAIRLVRVFSRWEVEPAAAGARVTYTYSGELGGSVPTFWVERAWRSQGPALLRRLADMARRRAAARADTRRGSPV